uniref:Uncharacterized protein n=1 Tax=Siphoviridae sp. ctt5z12 TaxID=2823604 RepID=A0A8S5LC46_9CAUD|nr:MAG TPA: hypothetical protein [Siphoviridae sp. ctt5z12]
MVCETGIRVRWACSLYPILARRRHGIARTCEYLAWLDICNILLRPRLLQKRLDGSRLLSHPTKNIKTACKFNELNQTPQISKTSGSPNSRLASFKTA